MRRFLSRWLARWHRALGGSRSGAPGDAAAHPDAAVGEPMLDCEAVMRQLWDYLDGELTPNRMGAIRAHLELCKRCYPQYEFERSFLHAVAARARQHADPERLRSRLADALRQRGLSET
jgi:anti-sigma factor (TIGR02949 family)